MPSPIAHVKLGFHGVIAINTGSTGTPTWSVLSNVAEAKISMGRKEAEASMRAYPLELTESTLRSLGFEGTIRSDDLDTAGYIALETAFIANAAMDILILDGPITTAGSRGVRCDMKLFKWDEDEGLEKVDFRNFELKPCIPVNGPPSDVTSGGGTLTYANMAA